MAIKVIVKNKLEEVTHAAVFETQAKADAWKAQEIANNSWGKPDRWLYENDLAIATEDIAQALESAVENIMGQNVTKYHFASEYTISEVDVTADVAKEEALKQRAAKRAFGEKLIDQISVINDSKMANSMQVDAFMSNPLIVSLREHLWAGNIPTFIEKLNAEDVSAFFSQAEKDEVIAQCEEFLLTL